MDSDFELLLQSGLSRRPVAWYAKHHVHTAKQEMQMSEAITVKVSSRNQIAVPRVAREKLHIRSGDRLLVDVQDGVLVLIPQPEDYVAHMAGLHRDVWAGVDTDEYIDQEREAWTDSEVD
jgi:AbrB family looped-hinge helix DNA binding protein